MTRSAGEVSCGRILRLSYCDATGDARSRGRRRSPLSLRDAGRHLPEKHGGTHDECLRHHQLRYGEGSTPVACAARGLASIRRLQEDAADAREARRVVRGGRLADVAQPPRHDLEEARAGSAGARDRRAHGDPLDGHQSRLRSAGPSWSPTKASWSASTAASGSARSRGRRCYGAHVALDLRASPASSYGASPGSSDAGWSAAFGLVGVFAALVGAIVGRSWRGSLGRLTVAGMVAAPRRAHGIVARPCVACASSEGMRRSVEREVATSRRDRATAARTRSTTARRCRASRGASRTSTSRRPTTCCARPSARAWRADGGRSAARSASPIARSGRATACTGRCGRTCGRRR